MILYITPNLCLNVTSVLLFVSGVSHLYQNVCVICNILKAHINTSIHKIIAQTLDRSSMFMYLKLVIMGAIELFSSYHSLRSGIFSVAPYGSVSL